jgi:hypothetical protein
MFLTAEEGEIKYRRNKEGACNYAFVLLNI